jgi:hypothetical protein
LKNGWRSSASSEAIFSLNWLRFQTLRKTYTGPTEVTVVAMPMAVRSM